MFWVCGNSRELRRSSALKSVNRSKCENDPIMRKKGWLVTPVFGAVTHCAFSESHWAAAASEKERQTSVSRIHKMTSAVPWMQVDGAATDGKVRSLPRSSPALANCLRMQNTFLKFFKIRLTTYNVRQSGRDCGNAASNPIEKQFPSTWR